MKQKQTVLHIIDSLGRGGAETLLVGVVNSIPHFEHIIVSLMPMNEFEGQLLGVKVYFLNFKGLMSVGSSAKKIRTIIYQHNIAVVHAHLYWSCIVSRFAVPKHVKLINSYHNVIYGKNGSNYSIHLRILDKLSYTKRVKVLCVSKEVLANVQSFIGVTDGIVLYNYVEDVFFEKYQEKRLTCGKLRFVSVGNLKPQKNYELLIKGVSIFNKQLGEKLISVDVFGKGELMNSLQQLVEKLNIKNIKFLGAVSDVASRLPNYDVYILPSSSEGFGIAVAEAMAVGLPVVVSDIPVLQEVTFGKAVYFDHKDPYSLFKALELIVQNRKLLQEKSISGHIDSLSFKKGLYMEQLTKIYI
ncbi:glycosyltransferase [Rufibacter roseus]|uniref:Glycosyltransferase n=1 Tax=Rufibacter roseus TaxID=1567108 RepID=A0ABW2DPV2_9BACT|nr:glycosyltransferase [Rufibacter roseus]